MKKLITLLSFCYPLLLLSQTCPEIIGYYPNWQWYDRGQLVKPTTLQYSKYSIINYAFFKPELNGSISSTDTWADENLLLGQTNWSTNPISYYPNTSIISLAHNAGVKVLPSIGGWTLSDNFPGIAASLSKRTNFAHACCDLIRTYQFDGIDIDWEYPGFVDHSGTVNDKQHFTVFLQQIRDSLTALGLQQNKNFMLTFCAGASRSNMQNVEWNNVKDIVDIINLMTYDFFGSWDAVANHNSPLYKPAQGDATFNLDSAVTYLLNHYNIPPTKLAAGVAFYGRSAKTSGTPALFAPITGTDNITFSDDDGSPLYYNVLKKLNLFTSHWDATAQVPYLTGNGSLQTFVSYDNEQSIGLKANYIKNKNLRGAIIWEITGDYLETSPGLGIIAGTPLVDTLKSVLCNGLSTNNTCSVPSGIGATSSSNSLSVSWLSTSASTYNVQYKLTTDVTWNTLSTNNTSIVINNLACNASYQVKIQSVCTSNTSAYSSVSTYTTLACTSTCNAPTAISATTTTSSISLTWTNMTAASYNIQYKKQTDNTWNTLSAASNTITLNTLLSATAYDVKIQSVCTSSSSAYSSVYTFTTQTSSTNSSCNYPLWNAQTVYVAGDTIQLNGIIYKAKYWTQNNPPSSNYGNCCAWQFIIPCGGYTAATCYKPVYDPLIAYTTGEQVYWNGIVYQAQWWTLNENPQSNSGSGMVWQVVSTTPCEVTMQVKAFLQGYYDQGGVLSSSDSLRVELHEQDVQATYPLLAFYKGLLQTNGVITCTFPAIVFGKTCYIVLKHRNSLETWSAQAVLLGSNNSYDFTTQNSQAYGNNQVLMAVNNWALYAGDINQDGSIDAFDYILMDPDIVNGTNGYILSDINGDGSADAFDYLLIADNIVNGVGISRP